MCKVLCIPFQRDFRKVVKLIKLNPNQTHWSFYQKFLRTLCCFSPRYLVILKNYYFFLSLVLVSCIFYPSTLLACTDNVRNVHYVSGSLWQQILIQPQLWVLMFITLLMLLFTSRVVYNWWGDVKSAFKKKDY